MIDVRNYMDDGADWQSQSVLAYVRELSEIEFNFLFDDLKKKNKASIVVGRLENCREQGYVFGVCYGKILKYFAVYEHRNVDDLCIVEFDCQTLNTPTFDQIPMKDKWDITKSFEWRHITEAGEYLINRFKQVVKDEVERLENENKKEEE